MKIIWIVLLSEVNDDLNMPRALAVVWDLVHASLPDDAKKATLLAFDQVMGLGLAELAAMLRRRFLNDILGMVEARQQARAIAKLGGSGRFTGSN